MGEMMSHMTGKMEHVPWNPRKWQMGEIMGLVCVQLKPQLDDPNHSSDGQTKNRSTQKKQKNLLQECLCNERI